MTARSKFPAPLDVDYEPLVSKCNGRGLFKLLVWELNIKAGSIVLKNDLGTHYEIGALTKTARRCSLAFLNGDTPTFVIEFIDNTATLFTYDKTEKTLKSNACDLTGMRDISLFYSKAVVRGGLAIACIKDDGVYQGTLVDNVLVIKNVNPLNDTTKLGIHKFGVDTSNKLVIELATLSTTS